MLCSVQCLVWSVKCELCIVQYSVCIMHFAVCTTVCSVHYAVYYAICIVQYICANSLKCEVCILQCATLSMHCGEAIMRQQVQQRKGTVQQIAALALCQDVCAPVFGVHYTNVFCEGDPHSRPYLTVINRPGVAQAVLQTTLSINNLLT